MEVREPMPSLVIKPLIYALLRYSKMLYPRINSQSICHLFRTEPISISYVVNKILNFTIPIGLFSFVIKLSCHVFT